MRTKPLFAPLAVLASLLLVACPVGRPDDDDTADGNLPVIEHDPVTSAVELVEIPILATVTPPPESEDAFSLIVTLYYRAAVDGTWVDASMEATDASDEFGAAIPADVVTVDDVEYYISALWGADLATHPEGAPAEVHLVDVGPAAMADPSPMRARYSSIEDAVELSWTPPGTSDFVGYSVDVVIDGADPVTVCTGGEPDAGCSVPADGIYDVEYATWTVTVVDGGNNGLSASAVTDGLHLLEDIWVKPHAPEDVAFGTGQGEFNLPFGVEVDDGSVHVAEQANNRLQTLTDEGDFLGFVGAIGGMTGLPGDGDGEFNAPMDVAVGDDGLLYVADHTNARVQVFDGITRQFQFEFGTLGEAEGQLRFPVALDFDGDGNLHVVESVNARVSVFDADGNFVSTYASIDGAPLDFPGRIAWLAELQVMAVSDGAVLRLYATGPGGSDATWELLDAAEDAEVGGVCTTEYGELVVTVDDAVTTGGSAGHRLLKVDRDGVVFGELGEWGVGDDQFWRPVSCDVDDDGVLWVADGLNHRVKLLGP